MVGVADVPLTLDAIGDDYLVRFSHGGIAYKVKFDHYPIGSNRIGDIFVRNSYSVTFYGPQGTASTGAAGTSATGVYSKVMAAIKKLMDTIPVDGLVFGPAEPAMGLIYDRLFQKMGGDFVRINQTTYVSREFLRSQTKNMDDRQKKDLYSGMLGTSRQMQAANKSVKQYQDQTRTIRLAMRDKVGKFVTMRGNKAFYVTKLTPKDVYGYYRLSGSGRVISTEYPYTKFSPNEPAENEIIELLQAIKAADFIDQSDTNLQAMFAKYNVTDGTPPTEGGEQVVPRGWDRI